MKKRLIINLDMYVPEAKTKEELRGFVRDILQVGSQYTLIKYGVRRFKIKEEKIDDN